MQPLTRHSASIYSIVSLLFIFHPILYSVNVLSVYSRSYSFVKRLSNNRFTSTMSSTADDTGNNQIKQEAVNRLLKQTSTWCGINGLMYTDGNLQWSHAPISLSPNPYPKSSFQFLQKIQPTLNKLVDKISRDRDFLLHHLADVRKQDDFTNKLCEIYETIPNSKIETQVQIGLHRSDYMLNSGDVDSSVEYPLQVEINTIASSFGCLSRKVGDFHRYILSRNAGYTDFQSLLTEVNYPLFDVSNSTSNGQSSELSNSIKKSVESIPENTSQRMLAFGLALGHIVFGDNNAIMIFIVQPGERNMADQRLLESELWAIHGIAVEFISLVDVPNHLYVDSNDYLKYKTSSSAEPNEDSDKLISVVYFRAGYGPNDYPSEVEWNSRILIENSRAVKCPSVGYQLAGTKKIQQVLSTDSILEKFLSHEDSDLIRSVFAKQYSFNSVLAEETVIAMENAINDGSRWVLKPQREGGGNNIYGQELSTFLKQNRDDPILQGYILMQRIFPNPQTTIFIRNGNMQTLPSISELGIYGIFVGDGSDTTLINREAGYLLRTKPNGVDEGGVAAGFSVLSSVVLIGEGNPQWEEELKENYV